MEENTTVEETTNVIIPNKVIMETNPKIMCVDNNKYGEFAILQSLADARADIRDVEADVKERITISDNQRQVAELNLHNRLCEAEKAAITANYESRIAVKDSESRLMARIEECCCENKEMLLALENRVNDKFCDLEKTRLQDEIAELREEKADGVNSSLMSAISSIASKIK